MNGFYADRPKDETERLAMIAFHKREMEMDEENETTYLYMNKDHLSKTKVKQGIAMGKRWKKESLRALKRLQDSKVRYFFHNEPRTWLS